MIDDLGEARKIADPGPNFRDGAHGEREQSLDLRSKLLGEAPENLRARGLNPANIGLAAVKLALKGEHDRGGEVVVGRRHAEPLLKPPGLRRPIRQLPAHGWYECERI